MQEPADRASRKWPVPPKALNAPPVDKTGGPGYSATMQLILRRRADEHRTPPATPAKPWWSFR